jgi:acetylornithine deacetylase/succinyl-diaminopimelate desuccinylase-like protein
VAARRQADLVAPDKGPARGAGPTLPLVLLLALAASDGRADVTSPAAERDLARAIYRELVEINTTDSSGDCTRAAEAMAARLRAAGLEAADVQVLGPDPRKGNLVARLRGTGQRRPLLLLAHLDVVEARREDWSFDPFVFREEGGYFYGRGTSDDKAMAAIFVANLIRYLREGFRPDRDLVLALTADEEGGSFNGVDWLLTNHRHLLDAELALNEGGGGQTKDGRRIANTVQASEKVFQSFRLEVKNRGGHSSLPVPDNAIYRLAEGLIRFSRYRFPARLNDVTRLFFERSAATVPEPEASDRRAVARIPPDLAAADRLSTQPYLNARLRTTCVATLLEGGHAENALPQTARATVNCRMLPDEEPERVKAAIVAALADEAIAVTEVAQARPSPPSPVTADVLSLIERISASMWPGVPVIPSMSAGATDAVFLRAAGIPVYGVDGIFEDVDDVRAHGRDERESVTSFYEGQEFLYRLVKALSSAGGAR